MQRAKQLTVCLPNQPGTLAHLCGALAEAKVSIRAITVSDATEACLVRLVLDNPSAGVKALKGMGLSVVETPVRLVEVPDKVGALAEMTDRLARRKVNLNFVYGSAGKGGKAVIVIEAKSQK